MNHQSNNKLWQDEYWALTLGVPVSLAFLPGFHDEARKGFAVLHEVPDWYLKGIAAAIAFAFYRRGLRGIRTLLPEHKPRLVKPLVLPTAAAT